MESSKKKSANLEENDNSFISFKSPLGYSEMFSKDDSSPMSGIVISPPNRFSYPQPRTGNVDFRFPQPDSDPRFYGHGMSPSFHSSYISPNRRISPYTSPNRHSSPYMSPNRHSSPYISPNRQCSPYTSPNYRSPRMFNSRSNTFPRPRGGRNFKEKDGKEVEVNIDKYLDDSIFEDPWKDLLELEEMKQAEELQEQEEK